MTAFTPWSDKIAVIGLGYVGLPLAVEFGRQRDVVGYDIDVDRVTQLVSGIDKTNETSPGEIKSAERLRFTSNVEDLKGCGIFVVTVPTPVDKNNRPDLSPLRSVSKMIGSVMQSHTLVIYESTTYPGCTEEDCVPELEVESGLSFNADFFVGYSPERINPGDKGRRLPDIMKVTSGSTPEVATFVDDLYKGIIKAGTHLAPSIKVAEAAKIVENTQRDLNISLMNELSLIFDRLDIDTSDVLAAAGTKWNFLKFSPGLVGGHCIGVDPYYLLDKSERVGYIPQVILSGRRVNNDMGRYVAQQLIKQLIREKVDVSRAQVGVLGLTFKENCPDTRNSKVIDVVNELLEFGVNVSVHDPYLSEGDLPKLGLSSVNWGVEKASVDAVVAAVNHDVYVNGPPEAIADYYRSETRILVDIRSAFDRSVMSRLGISVWRL